MKQMTIDEFLKNQLIEPKKVRKLKYYITLTATYTKCPYCGTENPDLEKYRHFPYHEKDIPPNYCYACKTRYDMDVATIKSQAIQALEWYKGKMGMHKNGGVSDEFLQKAKSEYKKHLQKAKYEERIQKAINEDIKGGV